SPLVELEVEGEGNAGPPEPAPESVPEPPPESPPEPEQSESRPAKTIETAPAATASLSPRQAPAVPSGATGGAVFASPATRRRAFELGIPLQFVPGTGPGGRVTGDDLDAYVAGGGGAVGGDSRYAVRE